MSFFGKMISDLLEPVGNGRKNNEADVKNIRSGLSALNYRTDEDKAQSIFTRPLDWAIKTFQSDEGLEQDGWLRPGGPTEERLGKRLKQSIPEEGRPLARTILEKAYDDEFLPRIKEDEGYLNKMYLDTKGYPTVGVGFMLPNAGQAKTYPFYKFEGNNPTDKRATSEEIEEAYYAIKKQSKGKGAESYQNATSIGLRNEDIDQRLYQKLRSSADELRHKFNGFDDVPKGVQMGLLDMQFNLGNAKLQRTYKDPVTNKEKGWPELFNAYVDKDWKKMAVQSHRLDIGEKRNQKVFDHFNDAK